MNLYDRIIRPLRHRILNILDLERRTKEESYVGTYHGSVDTFEEHLSGMGFRRNPFAWLRGTDEYGHSKGSWVKRRSLFVDEQLHVTLHSCHNGSKTRVYAHREDNCFRHPLNHLREKNVDCEGGVTLTKELLSEHVTNDKIIYY